MSFIRIKNTGNLYPYKFTDSPLKGGQGGNKNIGCNFYHWKVVWSIFSGPFEGQLIQASGFAGGIWLGGLDDELKATSTGKKFKPLWHFGPQSDFQCTGSSKSRLICCKYGTLILYLVIFFLTIKNYRTNLVLKFFLVLSKISWKMKKVEIKNKKTNIEQLTRSGWSWPTLHFLGIPFRPWSTSAGCGAQNERYSVKG